MDKSEPNQPQKQEQLQRLEECIKNLEDKIDKLIAKDREEKKKELKKEIEVLDLWITVASENGVFNQIKPKEEPIKPKEEPIQQQAGSTQHISNYTNKGYIDVPKSFEEAQEYLKLVWNSLYEEDKHAGKEDGTVHDNKPEANKRTNDNSRESSVILSIGECETYLSKVFEFYNESIEKLSKIQKFLIKGGHIIAYLTGILIFTIFATLVWNVHNYLNVGLFDKEYSMVIYNATIIGFVGGIVRSMYNIIHEVRFRVFRRASWAEYVMAPFIGGSFAFIITIGIIAGLIPETGQEQPQQQQTAQQKIKQPYGMYIIAFAMGVFWRNAINKLKNIVDEKGGLEEKDGKIIRIE